MRALVFSDVHANIVALETVLQQAGPVDAYWFLGDAVGYGPDPNQVLDTLRALPNLQCVLGNHDAAVIGRLPLGWFHLDAQRALLWTQSVLTESNLAFLHHCPLRYTLPGVLLVHGSPRDPLQEYLLSPEAAAENFPLVEKTYAFIGHSHIPLAWVRRAGQEVHLVRPAEASYSHAFTLPPEGAILNPGSVGQPRDGDPRAAYAIYDDVRGTWTWYRVPYDLDAAVRRFYAVPTLPPRFAQRLFEGR